MPEEVKSATSATEIAVSFMRKYYSYVRPLKAAREDNTWIVEIDVGAYGIKIAKVKLDAMSGDILEYIVPS